jgi:hypothetical protein
VTLLLFIAITFGVFSFGCVVLWAVTDSRFGKYALQKPVVTKSTFCFKDKELSEWLLMYYTTRVFLVCFVALLGYYLYQMMVV